MKKIFTAIVFCGMAFSEVVVAATNEPLATYKATKELAEKDFKIAKNKCDDMTGNPKDICVAVAKADRTRMSANANAVYKNTFSARTSATKDIANADYVVAKANCGSQVGNDKDVCIKKADAVKISSIANATASKKVSEAKSDAKADKLEANYQVAVEKCDVLVGTAKEMCLSAAKTKYQQ
ncbi:hypothetical protein ACO0LB_20220 [Undibacterium sp. SXout7W]|uniref:hypothetical protein n=1 Tax=Undibacterium sp. SXout7W TaxID=3413049 RepID=UPI003BEF7835